MEGRRTIIWGGALTALVLLSLGGATAFNGGVVGLATGGSGGCNGAPQEVPDEVPDTVGAASPRMVAELSAGPSQQKIDSYLVPGHVIVKLNDDAARMLELVDGKLEPREDLIAALRGGDSWKATVAIHSPNSDWLEHFLEGGDGVVVDPGALPSKAVPNLGLIIDLEVPVGTEAEAVRSLQDVDIVAWVERASEVEAASTTDLRGYQWNIDTLQLDTIHRTYTGRDVVIAVVDTGIEAGHRAFEQAALMNCQDLLDTGKGCVDTNGHGSAMAGLLIQKPFNGAIGLVPDATVLPVKVLAENGRGLTTTAASGIVFAADEGADVINVSWGTYAESRVLQEVIQYALARGAVVVAAAGNDGYTDAVMKPAAFGDVISVGCVDMSGVVCKTSNRGDLVDVWAPGGDVSVDDDGDGLEDGVLAVGIEVDPQVGTVVIEGTSPATATASAAVAMILQDHELSASAIRDLLNDLGGPVTLGDKVLKTGLDMGRLASFDYRPGKADGAACQGGYECASGVCEGQGCGNDTPGTCASQTRACTLDLRPYCGCDDETFFAGGTCPNRRYEHAGECAKVLEPGGE